MWLIDHACADRLAAGGVPEPGDSVVVGGQLVVGGAASNEWSEPFGADGDKVVCPLDSPVELVNRQCVWEVDATNKNLKIAAEGGDVTYSIAIIGLLNPATGECSSSA